MELCMSVLKQQDNNIVGSRYATHSSFPVVWLAAVVQPLLVLLPEKTPSVNCCIQCAVVTAIFS